MPIAGMFSLAPRLWKSEALMNPQSQHDAERAVVTACLAWPDTLPSIELEPSHFTSPLWRKAWVEILALQAAGELAEPIVVASRIGGLTTPSDLVAIDCSPGQALSASQELRSASVRREVGRAASEAIAEIEAGSSGSDALDEILRKLAAIAVEQPGVALPVGDLVRQRFLEMSAIAIAKERGEHLTPGIPTGLDQLDKMLGGIQRGIVTVAAARPGMGKSAFAMAVVDGASRAGYACHVFSLEDTRDAYADRVIARATRVPVESLRSCNINAGERQNIDAHASEVCKRKGWVVDDRSGITAEEIVRSVRGEIRRSATQLVVVDYLQLVKPSTRDARHEQLGHIMQIFANAAKQDKVGYLVLSQVNRGCESRDDKRPQLSDLKASGDIEEKAKAVLMLYRHSVYSEKSDDDRIEILIRKNNHGSTGFVEAGWDAKTIRVH